MPVAEQVEAATTALSKVAKAKQTTRDANAAAVVVAVAAEPAARVGRGVKPKRAAATAADGAEQ